MSDSTEKLFDQVAACQKLWMDSFTDMADVWAQFSPNSPPSEEVRKMRGGMLKVLAETWDGYMRTPQFLEMIKVSLNGALDVKRMARDGFNRLHEQLENPSEDDIDDIFLAIRHVERRILDHLEGLDDRVANLNEKIHRAGEGIAKQENAIINLSERIVNLDQRIATQGNAIEQLEQTVKTKVQKPAATPRKGTGA
jgi:hypothetical protein